MVNTVPLPQARHSPARREDTQKHATNRLTTDPADSCPNPHSASHSVGTVSGPVGSGSHLHAQRCRHHPGHCREREQ